MTPTNVRLTKRIIFTIAQIVKPNGAAVTSFEETVAQVRADIRRRDGVTLGFVGTDRLARDARAGDVRRERADMCDDAILTRVCARSCRLFAASRARGRRGDDG